MYTKFTLLILTAFLITSFSPPDQAVVGKVTFPLGNVLALSKGDTQFRKVTFNMPVKIEIILPSPEATNTRPSLITAEALTSPPVSIRHIRLNRSGSSIDELPLRAGSPR